MVADKGRDKTNWGKKKNLYRFDTSCIAFRKSTANTQNKTHYKKAVQIQTTEVPDDTAWILTLQAWTE